MSEENGNSNGAARLKNPKQEKFFKLRRLKCFREVDRRVKHGYPIVDIARYIHEDHGEYQKIKRTSLERVIRDYRDSLPPGEKAAHSMPQTFLKAKAEVEDGLNELGEMKWAYEQQKKRVEAMIATEETLPIRMPSRAMVREINVASVMLVRSAKLKMDLGLSKRHLGSLTVEAELSAWAEEKFGRRVAEVVKDPESRRKVISIFDHMHKLKEMEREAEEAADIGNDE